MKYRIWTFLMSFILKRKKVCLSRRSIISPKTLFEGFNKVGPRVNLVDSYIGKGTYLSSDVSLPYTKIGRFCSIGPGVKLISGQHPTENFVSTHPAFYSLLKQAGFTFVNEQIFEEYKYVDKENNYRVIIGNDVWIGANVLIKEGVRIKDGAIIGAGAIVTKDIEPYTINVGIPARSIKLRFDEEEIRFLLKFEWWNKDFLWLKENAKYFKSIKEFLMHVGGRCNEK
jgi:acetyltransferase-like isoleucine patch superfamily enzyme